MSYETVIEQVKATPVELLDEVSVFLNFLQYRSTQNQSKQKKCLMKHIISWLAIQQMQ